MITKDETIKKMSNIEELSHGQVQFLQRLTASHVVTGPQAQALWDDIECEEMGRDLDDTISRINESLKPGFNMEIRAISLSTTDSTPTVPVDSDGNPIASSSSSSNKPQSRMVYYAVVNCVSDDVSKRSAYPFFLKKHQNLEYFRLVLSQFIEKESRKNPSDDLPVANSRGSGCASSLSRIELINVRNQLPDALKTKMTITQAEKALKVMEVEGWLVPSDDCSEDNRNRRSSTGSSSNSLQIGPRTYMELSDFLCDLGLERDQLPQILLA